MTQRFFIDKIGETNGQLTEKQIAVLQRRATKQLDAMQNYARWERCRRRQILEYFGEDRIPENCDCDVCRAKKPRLKVSGRAEAVAVERPSLKAAGATSVEAVQRAIGPVVLASEDAQLSRMKDVRRDVVRSLGTIFFQHLPDELLRRLIANPPKYVSELRDDFEMHEKIVENFGSRILHTLGAKAAPPFEERPAAGAVGLHNTPSKSKERISRAKVAAAKEVAGGKVGALHGRAVEARFERLRTLRLELARKNHWPAYCVLQDATLLEIARSQPRTMRELLEIKGMGPKRAEKYGKELLAELAKE